MSGAAVPPGAVDAALAELGALGERAVSLAPFTTYKLGGPAAVMARPARVADLGLVAAAASSSQLPVLVLGRGSNMLVSDDGFSGIVVHLPSLPPVLEVTAAGDGATAIVEVSAGMALPVVARRLAGLGWRGFEWAVGVPGSIGGAVRMNAGGHGSDIAACLVDADVVDLGTGERTRRVGEQLDLAFRSSSLAADEVVVSARLRVAAGDVVAAEAEISEIVRWRRENQPGGQNAGSVFVNPVPHEVSAGSLVDAAGLRGFQLGTATVSTKHANFIQGSDGGSAADVRRLIEHVREAVATATGYRLRSEIRLVGFAEDER